LSPPLCNVPEWASAPVLIWKRCGSVRWCVDYRTLNALTTKDVFPLPLVDECLDTDAHSDTDGRITPAPNIFFNWASSSPANPKGVRLILCFTGRLVPVSIPCWSVRWCVDYRALSALTTKDVFPLPLVDGCLDTLAGNVWYSKPLEILSQDQDIV
jgi:hypothetical protein